MPFFSLPTGGASPVLVTNGPPTGSLGNPGDLAIDAANKLLYGPKDAVTGWPTGIDLSQGPTGAASTITGPTGPQVTGPTGATGGIAFSATGPTAPTGASLTLAGAVWLDDSTGRYYVRYATNWVEIGVQGERGPTGNTGPVSTVTGPTGSTGPASTVTGPTGSTGPSVTGPTGAQGVTGPSGGPTGSTGPTGAGARGGINVQAATGTITLDGNAAKYQFISATDDNRTLTLPTGVDSGFDLFIKETGNTYTLTVETTTATGVANLGTAGYYNKSAVVVWDGTTWRVIYLESYY